MKLALDSNVFIAYLQQDDTFFDPAKTILEKLSENTVVAVFSTLVFGEVMYGAPPNSSIQTIKSFFNDLGAVNVPADSAVCFKATELRLRYSSLKLPDAIHLATAIIAKADIFITADKPLVKIARLEIKTIMLGKSII